jgi:hypothetical protein
MTMETDDIDETGEPRNVDIEDAASHAANQLEAEGAADGEPAADRKARRHDRKGKRGRKLGSKNKPAAEGVEPKPRTGRKDAHDIKDPRSAMKRLWEDGKVYRQQVLAESPGSDAGWVFERFDVDSPPPEAPVCVVLPSEVVKTILASSMGLLATGLGVGEQFQETASSAEYATKLETCAAAWSEVSKYYPIVSPGPLAVAAAVAATVTLAQPIGQAYFAKRAAARLADPALAAVSISQAPAAPKA